jgi:hypothetical protein
MRACIRRAGTILAVALFALLAIAPDGAPASAEPGPIVVGIVLRDVEPAFAVILDSVTSKPGFYGVGARVGAAVITEILADRVIIVTGGQQTHLRLAPLVSPGPARIASDATARRDEALGARRPSISSATAVEPPPSPYSNIATVTAAGASTGGTGASGGSEGPMGIAAQGGGPTGSSAGTQNGLSATLTLTGHLHNGSSQQGDQFSTTSLRDLLISMTYSNVSGTHRQRLELYAPDGSLYQKLSGAVAPSTKALIPVGGTWITEHSLFGDWRVDVYVDRETTPITSHAFTLLP